MFNLLKKKLKGVIDSISKKLKKKEEVAEKIEKIEKVEELEKVEEVKETLKEIKPEKKISFQEIKRRIIKKIREKKISEKDLFPILDELEKGLLEADVAYPVVEKIKEDLRNSLINKEVRRGKEREIVISSLKKSLLEILSIPPIDLIELVKKKRPMVILFLGFNGSGKTTTLAKIGKWLMDNGYSCIFAAADTFRAASIEQLEEHAKKLGVKVIKHKYGADPAAVVFDAVRYAETHGIDFVLADTAGRTHTNVNLMEEMKKIIRVNKPDLKILVMDSLTGNDALLQARFFNELGVDALVFTKLDVNEKGGCILSVVYETKKPILFLGIGQSYSDIKIFNAEKFVENLLA